MRTGYLLATMFILSITPIAAKDEWTPKNGASPWHDRVGRWVTANIPDELEHGKKIPQQSCTLRSLVLPKKGIKCVLIGVSDSNVAILKSRWSGKISDTGLDFNVQAPGGKEKIPYSVFTFSNPAKVTIFRDFTAGIILLSLDGRKLKSKKSSLKKQNTRKPVSGILDKEWEIEAQEWPFNPGPRKVKLYVEEPAKGIDSNTGMMLCLHNWGGKYNDSVYLRWCRTFADRYNVVTCSVNYLQSGGAEPKIIGEKPYDHGYLQAIDCLRALYHIDARLKKVGVKINTRRCYAMGGSGGGNVSLMVNKLAPHTFACVVDICGMPGLTDGIAFGTGEYGSHLNAGYSRDPQSPAYLTKDMQEIRDPGHLGHLEIQRKANPDNKVIIVHGLDDETCPVVHKITIFRNMVKSGFHTDGHFLTKWFIDNQAVKATKHSLGDREKIVIRFADSYMKEDGEMSLETPGASDLELAQDIVFPTSQGRFVVNYSSGPPSIRFEKND